MSVEPDVQMGRIRVWAVSHDALAIPVADADAGTDSDSVDAMWNQMVRTNPKLYDAPILSVCCFDPASQRLSCRLDTYKRLVVQPAIDTGVNLLAVTGVVLACDDRGVEHVLLGLRARDTRIYGGMWELAPSGGVEPELARRELGAADLRAQLGQEMREELALPIGTDGAEAVALCYDTHAHSTDVVYRVRTDKAIKDIRPTRARDWEYLQVMWLPTERAEEFARSSPQAINPQTLALLRFFGWLGRGEERAGQHPAA